jgi:hypothetical protein
MKNILNKNIVRTLLIVSLVWLTACESFLDLKPTNALLADDANYDATTARALVNSAYSSLKNYTAGVGLYSPDIVLGALPADNVFFGGSQSQNIELDNYAFTVTNSAIVAAYRLNYSIINITNWAISEIPKVKDDVSFAAGEADKLVGEAHFIRAFAYFNLVRSWGGVQLQLNPTTDLSSLGSIPRSSKDETYSRIFDDLTTAEELLPADDTITRNKVQRAVVKAFRAKVHLYAQQFEQAESYATEVIANPKYELVKPYSAFSQEPFLTKESVFEISATANSAGTSSTVWFPSSVTQRGSYEFRPTNEIIELLNDPAKGGTRNSLIAKKGNDTYVNLYRTVTPNLNPAYVIRIADLYLIRAEARLRKASPDYAGAIADLNAVRDRAEAELFPTGSTDKNAILHAVWDERRLEFAFEADRWYDLVRTEQAGTVLGVSENSWLFPIPQADVLADPDLGGENNPGY